MIVPKQSWPGVALALFGAVAMLVAGAGLALTAAIFLLWLGTLALVRPSVDAEVAAASPEPLNRANVDALLEPLEAPLLVIERDRVASANAAARTLLGAHIVGQDVRIALRRPEAVALLEQDGTATVPGLTGPRSVWQITRRAIDERQAIIELADRTAEADVSRAHTDFVANASHELSTPLASIIGYVETLAEAGPQLTRETTAKFLGTVLNEARRLQNLVRDLMSLSRVEAEKHDRPRERVELAGFAASIAGEILSARGDDRIEVAPTAGPVWIQGDRAQLDQLLRNLIDNALKYGGKGQPVTVSVTSDGRHATLSVKDRGPGIAPAHLPHLTRRFYRTDPGRSRAAGGTGLGLAIVKHIVERHRGQLDIASTQGDGTLVSVRFAEAARVIHNLSGARRGDVAKL